MVTLYTFGDSILDCGRYNAHGVHPGALLVRNDDRLFPEFRGRDLASRGAVRLVHRAVDGATVDGLERQARGLPLSEDEDEDEVALVTIGGNDLLAGLVADRSGRGFARFRERLDRFLRALPVRPVLLGNVYDPTLGDDARNFLPLEPAESRAALARMNALLADLVPRYGALVDVHGHFLERGDPSWYEMVIEPSLLGASEVRRCFLEHILPGNSSGVRSAATRER